MQGEPSGHKRFPTSEVSVFSSIRRESVPLPAWPLLPDAGQATIRTNLDGGLAAGLPQSHFSANVLHFPLAPGPSSSQIQGFFCKIKTIPIGGANGEEEDGASRMTQSEPQPGQ